MFSHLSQAPDSAAITLADLTDNFMEVLPISTSQVETSVDTAAQVAFPEELFNSSSEVSLVLLPVMLLLMAGWYSNTQGHASIISISKGNISIASGKSSCL